MNESPNNPNSPETPEVPVPEPGFVHRMSRTQKILGWIWLPMYLLVVPLAIEFFNYGNPGVLSEGTANLAAYGVSAVALGLIMFRYWRADFEALLDRPGRAVLSALLAMAVNYALSMAVTLLLYALSGDELENPNNAAMIDIAQNDYGAIKAAAVFLAPIVEETLFRGLIFGSIRPKHRVLAYVVSALAFCLLHVWQYVLISGDFSLLIYSLQYVPSAVALAYCYERSGSIWTPILLHIILNAMAFTVIL